MWMLISYDVETQSRAGRRRLRRIAKICESYGHRVQQSVFECQLDAATWTVLRGRLLDTFDNSKDSLRFYCLGETPSRRNEHHGQRPSMDMEGPLIL